MRDKFEAMKRKTKGICKKVIVPSLAATVMVMSQMTTVVYAAGDTSAVTKDRKSVV